MINWDPNIDLCYIYYVYSIYSMSYCNNIQTITYTYKYLKSVLYHNALVNVFQMYEYDAVHI